MKRRDFFTASTAAGLALGMTGLTEGAEGAEGKDLYDKFCAQCHGVNGDGQGYVAAFERYLRLVNNAVPAEAAFFWGTRSPFRRRCAIASCSSSTISFCFARMSFSASNP